MKRVAALLLALLLWPALAQAQAVRLPAGASEAGMPALARETLAVYRDDDRARYLGNLFRLQLVAGQYPQAIQTIEAVRALRADTDSQPPLYLQYEIHARAKLLQAKRGLTYVQAWQETFSARFGALPDKTALRAEPAFRNGLPRLRKALDDALAAAAGKQSLPLAEALDLLRAYQVHAAYAAFSPYVDAAIAEEDARRYHIDRDLLLATSDGVHIAALLVRPRNTPPLPALMQFTIYANDDWSWADAKTMAAHGYAGVVAYSRSEGRSPDAITPFEHDGADAAAVIDWIAAQPWSDGRVGMFGGSYNSFAQWAALKHRPKALKAIATSASAAPGIDVPMEGGVFLNFMYPWPFYTSNNRWLDEATYNDSERWQALDSNWYASGRAYRELPAIDGQPNPVFSRWLQHPAYDAYWQAMIPQGRAYADIDIPVLAITGYFDGAQIGVLHYLREHLRQRPDADHTLLIGPYEHFTVQTGVPPVVQGYAVDASARVDLQALRLDWFDHIFKGAPKPELLAGRVNWQLMGADSWRHADTLDAMSNDRQRLYLLPGAAGGTNVLSRKPAPKAATTQRVDFNDRSNSGWRPPSEVQSRALDPHLGLVFVGEPLAQAADLSGPFSGLLEFSSNKRDVDVAISIFELDANGQYFELAYWLQRASYASDRRARKLLKPGARQQLAVKDTRLLGRRLAAGSRLVVTLGVVKQPDRQLNLGSGREPADETIADAGEPLQIRWQGSSYLDLPALVPMVD